MNSFSVLSSPIAYITRQEESTLDAQTAKSRTIPSGIDKNINHGRIAEINATI